jgi:hypothetical protein
MSYLNQLIEENKLNQIGKLININKTTKEFYYFSVTNDDDGVIQQQESTGKII